MDCLQRLGIPKIGLTAIWTLYETLSGCIRTSNGLSNNVLSTIGVKQGCPLSPTLFVLYIDELETFLLETVDQSAGCLLYGSQLPIFLFADDIVLLSHSVEDLQRLVDT